MATQIVIEPTRIRNIESDLNCAVHKFHPDHLLTALNKAQGDLHEIGLHDHAMILADGRIRFLLNCQSKDECGPLLGAMADVAGRLGRLGWVLEQGTVGLA